MSPFLGVFNLLCFVPCEQEQVPIESRPNKSGIHRTREHLLQRDFCGHGLEALRFCASMNSRRYLIERETKWVLEGGGVGPSGNVHGYTDLDSFGKCFVNLIRIPESLGHCFQTFEFTI